MLVNPHQGQIIGDQTEKYHSYENYIYMYGTKTEIKSG